MKQWTDRTEVLERYRSLRSAGRMHLSDVMKFVGKNAFGDAARRIGLKSRRTIVADSFDEMTLAMDLAVFGAKPGRSRAIDRYANARTYPPESVEAVVLRAMLHDRFGVYRVLRRHEVAGLIVEDLFRNQQELWLMDEGFEATADEGLALAGRLLQVDAAFWMTAGVAVPTDRAVLGEVFARHPEWVRDDSRAFLDLLRFAEAIYAESVTQGRMQYIRFGRSDDE